MSRSVPKPGRVHEVSSVSNPLVKSIKGLALKKNRDVERVFLAEGQKLVTDALEAGWTVRTLIHAKTLLEDPRQSDAVSALAVKVRATGGDILIVSEKVLTAISRRDNAQMIMAVIEQKTSDPQDLNVATDSVWVALDRVRDPGNLGTIIRTADALGVGAVMLVGQTADPFSMEAVRATMGSLFHVPLIRLDATDFRRHVTHWRDAHGGQVIGTHLAGAVDHRSIDYSGRPQLIVMGNEQQGLPDELAEICDKLALIAMSGEADSLNLAVATGIMLFEARRNAL